MSEPTPEADEDQIQADKLRWVKLASLKTINSSESNSASVKDKMTVKTLKTVLSQTIVSGRIGKNRVISDSRKALAVTRMLKCESTVYF